MKEKDKSTWSIGLYLFSQLTAWIAGPIILAVIVGKWLDNKYNTGPWLFLICIFIAFILSNIGIVKQSLKSMKKIENIAKKSKDSKDN